MATPVSISAAAIITGLENTIGVTAGVIAKWEAYPIVWPTDAQLPMALLALEDFRQEQVGSHLNQTYYCGVYFVAQNEVNTSEPVKYCRQQAELIADALMQDRTLGINGNYTATVTGFSLENELQALFVAEKQRRTCYKINLIIEVYEDAL